MTGTIFITGGSSGIGLALSRRYAAKGWRLLWASLDADEIAQARAILTAERPDIQIEALAIDLAKPAAPARAAAWAAEQGGADILVNNAGFGVYGASCDLPIEAEQAMMAVNMAAPHALCRLMLPALEARAEQTGQPVSIVNIASNSAFTPAPFLAMYAATKAFVRHYSDALALELAEAGSKVRVHTICPSAVADTPFRERADMDDVRTFSSFTATTAAEVARDVERAIEAGRRFTITGWRMRAAYIAMKLMPAPLVRALTRREVGRV
ncbi:MAG: SDR family NAD(P)-dependent oxidoreductase [Pseudomonadota bacterium]